MSIIDKEIDSEYKLHKLLKKGFKKQSSDFSNQTLDIIDEEYQNELIINGKYKLGKELGKGSFGIVYEATDDDDNVYAIKTENHSDYKKHLLKEQLIYSELKNFDILKFNKYFANKYYYGNHIINGEEHRVLVLDKLGKSLKYYFDKDYDYFDMKTLSSIAIQVISRLKFMHLAGWLHQDIKPENILVDNNDGNKIYLVDFGTSARIKNEYGKSNKIVGTSRYAPIEIHLGNLECPRDDLESFGYVLIYLATGTLPWQGVKAKDIRTKWNKVGQIKRTIDIKELCFQLPKAFYFYFRYLKTLSFYDIPDYTYLRNLFIPYVDKNFKFPWCL